uniref:Uncharacterized protein n=1 Tax=Solanum lycopersicum TaxID=4081 RepID=A0A3Q7ES40_SOLLC
MSSSGRSTAVAAGDLQIVAASGRQVAALPPRPPASSSTALVEYTPPAANPEEEDLEIKLRRILECVPVRVSNTSGSSAGSGSGDFHQYRQMRRREQDRLARMDVDYQRRKEAEKKPVGKSHPMMTKPTPTTNKEGEVTSFKFIMHCPDALDQEL